MEPWNNSHLAELTKLSSEVGPLLTQMLPKLDANQRHHLVQLTGTVQDQLSLGQLGLLGYDTALAGHEGFGSMQLAAATKEWVANRTRPAVASTLAGMMACSLCAVLESFVSELGDHHPDLELHRRSDGAEWVRALEASFDFELELPIAETLTSLVDARREFAFDPSALEQLTNIAMLYAAWPQACVLLAARVAGRLAQGASA